MLVHVCMCVHVYKIVCVYKQIVVCTGMCVFGDDGCVSVHTSILI